jgi:hypothetical protein
MLAPSTKPLLSPIDQPVLAPAWKRELAALCIYFNPCHFSSRGRHYVVFRQDLEKVGIRLLTVELAFGDDDFELKDFDDILCVRSPDVMWQKERLLNIGLQRLVADGFSKAAWLDTDIRFLDPAWPENLARALEHVPLCQAFSHVLLDGQTGQPSERRPGLMRIFKETGQLRLGPGEPGFAWGARLDLLQETGLYDAFIVGGADLAIVLGASLTPMNPAFNQIWQTLTGLFHLNSQQQAHYRRWADGFCQIVHGMVGHLNGVIETMPHGSRLNRRYHERYRILSDFDPFEDIVLNGDQCWCWATAKPELHRRVREYFELRREDE